MMLSPDYQTFYLKAHHREQNEQQKMTFVHVKCIISAAVGIWMITTTIRPVGIKHARTMLNPSPHH